VVSQTGGHIACCLSDGSVALRNAHTKHEDILRGIQPAVTIRWLSFVELAVATKNYTYFVNINTGGTKIADCVLNPVWGMVVLSSDEVAVGTSLLDTAGEQESCIFSSMKRTQRSTWSQIPSYHTDGGFRGQLTSPMHIGNKIVCVTPPNGVRAFDTPGHHWTQPPLLEKAKSLAASLNRNLVVQTEDSVQIFSFDVLASDTSGKDERPSHVYPLGENHAVCLLANRHLTIIEL
jgi:hypothetical protein